MIMEAARLRELLTNYDESPQALVDAFNTDILARAVESLNRTTNLRQMGKLAIERLPQNERNLTDVRTRLGVLLEYALATVINAHWQERLGGDHTLCFVVANRYPDLVSRDRQHRPGMRIEVKAIEAISEEKSANLDVLVRDTRATGDILCVLVWEWKEAAVDGTIVEYPHIYRAFAFSERTIAKIRDVSWLHNMSRSTFKGIDIGGPVVGSGGGLKEEEHNMGKLLRIGAEEDFGDPSLAPYKDDPNVRLYEEFRRFTITLGIQTIVRRAFSAFGMTALEEHISNFQFQLGETRLVAIGRNDTTRLAIFGGTSRGEKLNQVIAESLKLAGEQNCYALIFGEKFTWFLCFYDGETLIRLTEPDKKPWRATLELEKHFGAKPGASTGASK